MRTFWMIQMLPSCFAVPQYAMLQSYQVSLNILESWQKQIKLESMITTKAFTLTRLKKLTMWNDSDMPMPLICNNEERDKDCFLEIWHDFKDCFFLLSKMAGLSNMNVLNAAELKAHGWPSGSLHGILVLCLIWSLWGSVHCIPFDRRRFMMA